jgi:tight adherence protein C
MDLIDLLTEGNSTMVGLLVFLAAGTLAFGIMAALRVQGSVKRRAANIGRVDGFQQAGGGSRSLRQSSLKAAQRVVEYTAKHYSSGNVEETKVLRRRMIQAGIYDPRAVAYFFLARAGLAVGLAVLAFMFVPSESGSAAFWLWTGFAGILGYTSTGALRRANTNTSPAFRTSWTCWWFALTRASAWKRRSSALVANSRCPIHR